jgi:flagellar hook-associated protein 3 FlgL
VRITNKYIADSIVDAIRKSTEKLADIQHEVSTGKKVNRLSDDPISASRILDYNSILNAAEQYQRNNQFGLSWARSTESTMDSVSEVMRRVKELAVYQSTDTANSETRKATANEVRQLLDELLRLANTKFQGRYIFAGFKTEAPTFEWDYATDPNGQIVYKGDEQAFEIILSENERVTINLLGSEVFGTKAGSTVNLFETVKKVAEAMEANDQAGIASELDNLTTAINHVNQERAKIGGVITRLEGTIKFFDEYKNNITDLLSQLEDADMADAMTRLATQQTLYQASLAAAARIMSKNLLDFI